MQSTEQLAMRALTLDEIATGAARLLAALEDEESGLSAEQRNNLDPEVRDAMDTLRSQLDRTAHTAPYLNEDGSLSIW